MLHNPFSTKNTSPGKIPYYFGKEFFSLFREVSLDFQENFQISHDKAAQQFYQGLYYLYLKFSKFEYRSQIIGPHGSGKTTLLVPLINILENCNHKIISVTLHDNKQKLPMSFWKNCKKLKEWIKSQDKTDYKKKTPIIVIDGYEQLSVSQRKKILQLCFTEKWGILATTHKIIRQIPILFRTKTSPEILEEIVNYLLKKNGQTPPFDHSLYFTLLEQYHGNIRDILFSLYDLYE